MKMDPRIERESRHSVTHRMFARNPHETIRCSPEQIQHLRDVGFMDDVDFDVTSVSIEVFGIRPGVEKVFEWQE